MNLLRIVFVGSMAMLLLGATDAPPEVESALRARAQEFYQLQKDHKYREAEEFVAADTKEYYFNARKATLISFRIVGIDFAPDFDRATVRLQASSPLPMPGADLHPLEAPVSSEWKIEDGKWYWYVDQSKLLDTPFGRVHLSDTGAQSPTAGSTTQAAVSAAIQNAVQISPRAINIDADHPVPQVLDLKNTLPGPVTIQLLTESKALNIRIAKPNLGANESTQVTISLVGGSGLPRTILLRVAPVGQEITIPMSYGPAKK